MFLDRQVVSKSTADVRPILVFSRYEDDNASTMSAQNSLTNNKK